MTGVGSSSPSDATGAQYQDYCGKTAAPRDSTVLSAKARYRNRYLTVVELNTWQYYTGAAHGISATQFLNWDNSTGKVLAMADILEPGKEDAYVRSEEHTSELQSLMRISYAVFRLKKKKLITNPHRTIYRLNIHNNTSPSNLSSLYNHY